MDLTRRVGVRTNTPETQQPYGFAGFLSAPGYTEAFQPPLSSQAQSLSRRPATSSSLVRIQVPEDVQSGLHIFVPQPFADEQNVRAKLDQQIGVAVPLRYNL